jgi:HEAT repeat protein
MDSLRGKTMNTRKIRGLCFWLFAMAAACLAGGSKADAPDEDREPHVKSVEYTALQEPDANGAPLTGKELVQILERLRKDIRSKNSENRKRAAEAIGMAADRLGPLLLSLNGGLDDRDDEVRIACLKSIAKLGSVGQGIGNRLVDLMRSDKNPKVRLAAANAVSAVYALSRFHKGIAAYIPTIESVVFEDQDREVRKAAIWALRAVAADSASAVPTYVRILKSKQDPDSREIVMLGIVDIGPHGKDAVPQLLALLRDGTEPSLLRGLAASALGNIGYNADEVVPVFLMLLEDAKQNELHGAILVGIENYGPKATDAASAIGGVLKQTKGKNGQPQIDLRSQAVRALGAVMPNDPETRKVLERMVNDESEPIPVRIAAANALKIKIKF